GQLACQNPTEWTTWSILPCDPVEDAYISDNYAYSGTNSAVIVQNNDEVKPLGSQTSGKWDIGFMVYIPAGHSGYFNTLSGFTPNPFQWAMECYFDVGGGGRLEIATSETFTWTEDTWQLVRLVIDLDTDLAEFWFNGSMVASWQWTRGGSINLQLDANDFFGATFNDEMYIDDYMFGQFPFVPVELTSFTANVNHSGQVELNWSTASETNNQMFEIERRTEEGQFATIGYVEGHGTTTEPQNYTYTDATVSTGIYFYRLKQLDFLGYYEYFDEIEVDVNGPLTFDLEQNYPNPFNPSTNIKFSVPESSNVRLAVYNLIGEEVAVLFDGFSEAGFYEVTFDASSLSSGAYFYKLQSGNSFVTKKMLLMK
ncbi:T9SS type A sorting domain-containing protein, partial [Patescibacteria group bacterium]|nr:T9SS type A sorting domain-containing protein [Patescibacteria group bacterium]